MPTSTKNSIIPWIWVPSVYLMEGIPYYLVNSISIALFTQLGMSTGEMALFTTLITLPWILKPIWSPMVDNVRTKRWWILMMQGLMAFSIALIALLIPHGYTTGALVCFTLTAFLSATHDIAADGYYMLALDTTRQAGFAGVRSTFNKIASVLMQAVLLKLVDYAQRHTDIAEGWSLVLLGLSVLIVVITAYHTRVLPHAEQPADNHTTTGLREVYRGYADVFRTYFLKPGLVLSLAFMLIYRLPEALLLKLYVPFFMDHTENGGLALSLNTIGDLNAINLIMTIAGGLLGGVIAARWGLKRTILFFTLALTLPCAVYVYMAATQTQSFPIIATCIGFEQFGYGLGYTACILYMMHISEGTYATAHFSICTAFMYLGLFLPGLVAGYLQQATGYLGFFVLVMLCCIPSIGVASLVYRKLD